MKVLRIDFHSSIDVLRVRQILMENLESSVAIPGDAFDWHIERQSEIISQVGKTDRGKASFIASAEGLKRRYGPGCEMYCAIAGIRGIVLISRRWIVAKFDGALPEFEHTRIVELLKSLGDGDFFEFDTPSSAGGVNL